MCFKMDISEINIKFQINDYWPTNKDNWDSKWCKCDFLFFFLAIGSIIIKKTMKFY